MKSIIPKICPSCGTGLIISNNDDIIKLMCPNINCGGSSLRKLEKGVAILEIKGVGPATLKLLHEIGISDISDIFDKSKVNEKNLIKSGLFKKGRQLEKILQSIDSIKEIRMDKCIESLQIVLDKDDGDGDISIGKSLSLQISRLLSGLSYDFDGLSIQVRQDIIKNGKINEGSELIKNIRNKFKIIENNGIKIIPLEEKKIIQTKQNIKKKVCFDIKGNYSDIIKKLDWEEVDVSSAEVLVVDDKNQVSDKVKKAQELGIKILTLKQLQILFL